MHILHLIKSRHIKLLLKRIFQREKCRFSSSILGSRGTFKLVLLGSWTSVIIGCSTFQYAVCGNVPIPPVFSLFFLTYLEVSNILYNLYNFFYSDCFYI